MLYIPDAGVAVSGVAGRFVPFVGPEGPINITYGSDMHLLQGNVLTFVATRGFSQEGG